MEMAEPPYLSITQEVRTDKLDLESHEMLHSPRLGINEKEINNPQIAKRAELDEELKHLVIPRVVIEQKPEILEIRWNGEMENDKDYLDDVSDLTELGEDATADDASLEDNVYRESIEAVDSDDNDFTDEESNFEDNTEASVSASEKIIDQLIITEEEKEANSEFFCGKAAKTPERYMKIRNHILNAWIEGKPNYVTKTSIRTGLKDCGDVNAIGRVHTYLEVIGAINVGEVSIPPKTRRPYQRRKYEETVDGFYEFGNIRNRKGYFDDDWAQEGPRRRRVRDDLGRWVNEKDLYNTDSNDRNRSPEPWGRMRSRSMRKQRRYTYDPFQLIPPNTHGDLHPAPFRITITDTTMLVMDFHSHLVHTEIIGLLGGKYIPDQSLLEVSFAFPCQSISTGYQCEMDPGSEVKAREAFESKGLEIVGWYHSHPVFEPHPSIRDMENQSRYQDYLASPFIGIIVSPYKPDATKNISSWQVFWADFELDPLGIYRLPYECLSEVVHLPSPPIELLTTQFAELLKDYREHKDRVEMNNPWCEGGISRLDHLISSLSSHLAVEAGASRSFLIDIRSLIESGFAPVIKEEVEKSYNFEDDIMNERNYPADFQLLTAPIARKVAGKQPYDLDLYPSKVEEKTNYEETEIIPFHTHGKGPSTLHPMLIANQKNIFDKNDDDDDDDDNDDDDEK
ncbi:hypothetical protein G9A89_001027 [Geosiphon pyriformis]|nr:hypothetical protein G9A89_001027 [Geosiphon pyriformis]